MRRALILVEGQTEERFAKDLLYPHLLPFGLALEVTVIPTKKVLSGKDFKGGVTHFGQVEKAMRPLLNSGDALVTTLFDYYRLPADAPGMSERLVHKTSAARVAHVQSSIARHFGSPEQLKVYLSLHEFEALMFSGPEELAGALNAPKLAASFAAIVQECGSPEQINERPDLSPSRRIKRLAADYQKDIDGPNTASRIGLIRIRQSCPHFSEWLACLEQAGRKT